MVKRKSIETLRHSEIVTLADSCINLTYIVIKKHIILILNTLKKYFRVLETSG